MFIYTVNYSCIICIKNTTPSFETQIQYGFWKDVKLGSTEDEDCERTWCSSEKSGLQREFTSCQGLLERKLAPPVVQIHFTCMHQELSLEVSPQVVFLLSGQHHKYDLSQKRSLRKNHI